MVNTSLLMRGVNSRGLDPAARIQAIRDSGAILFEYIGGSIAYGTNLPESDKDLRGCFCLPRSQYLGLSKPVNGISDERETEGKKKNDDQFYTFSRIFKLLKGSNPNCLEALWIPSDCVISSSPEFEKVIANRHLFISKECIASHCGYAKAQCDRARGKNKKVNNPQKKTPPVKEDFCRIIPCIPDAALWTHPDMPSNRLPFRQLPLKDMPWIDLKDYHIAAVEHMQNAYRLYCYYGEPSCKGVFRGDGMLVCESIPIEDEHPRFSGILLYDKSEYERALKDWQSYHEWIKNRNVHRWVDQEGGKLQFDSKSMAHCMRLMMSALNVVKNGEPLVRLSGKNLDEVMAIRTGKRTDYNSIIKDVDDKLAELRSFEKASTIPDTVDHNKIEALYGEVSEMAWQRLFGGIPVLSHD